MNDVIHWTVADQVKETGLYLVSLKESPKESTTYMGEVILFEGRLFVSFENGDMELVGDCSNYLFGQLNLIFPQQRSL